MAYDANELFDSNTVAPFPRIFPLHVVPKTFAAGTLLLKVGAPLAVNSSTGHWQLFDVAGVADEDTIRGFVYPDEIQLVAGGEVLGQVMVEGEIHADDVLKYAEDGSDPLLPATQGDTAEVTAALLSGPRLLNLHITGLAGVK